VASEAPAHDLSARAPGPGDGATTRRVTRPLDLASRPLPVASAAVGPAPQARAFLRAPILLLLLAAVLAGIVGVAYLDRWLNLGVTWGVEQTPIAGAGLNPMAVNVFLDKEVDPDTVRHTLRVARDGGFTMIRQGFPWSDLEISGKGDFTDRRTDPPRSAWAKYDFIVEQAHAYGLQILARLDAPPDWARKTPVSHSPPRNNADYADYVAAVVSRYKGQIRYFQIWNEPNLEGEWAGQPDPAEYTALLKAAYQAAHAANPDVVVLMAPLAPTAERGPANINDLIYMQGMYDAGAGPYFDLGNVVVYGLGYSPEERRTGLDRINFSRPVLTRAVMERNGDAAKGMWASEYGYMSLPPDWAADPLNKPSIWGNDSAETQAAYLVDGYQRARAEWPWMGPMFVWMLREPDPIPHEPQPYFSILNPDFTPRPAFIALQRYSRRFPIADTGAGEPTSPALRVEGPWERGAVNGRPVYTATAGSRATLTFQGQTVALVFAPGQEPGQIAAQVDGAPAAGWPVAAGQAIVTVPAAAGGGERAQAAPAWPGPPGETAVRVEVAGGLAAGRHTLAMETASGSPPLALLGFVVARPAAYAAPLALAYGLLTLLAMWLGVRSTFALVALPGLARRAMARPGLAGDAARAGVAVTAMAGALAAYYFAPWAPVALVAFAAWVALAVWRPDMALVVTAATFPFFWAPRVFGEWSFPLSETCVWGALAAWMIARVWRAGAGRGRPAGAVAARLGGPWETESHAAGEPWGERARLWLRRDLFGAPAVALLALGTFSLLTVANPDYLKDSLHAYRWVIVEPVLFYFLATDIRPGRRQAYRLADGFVAGAALAALIATAQGALNVPGHTLEVQGVIRWQGLFSHPDNLGLFMGRAIAVSATLALVLRAPSETWRRRWYALATLLMLPALVFSFSRGAWLAVAAALGVTLLMVGGRLAWGLLGAGAAGGAGLLAAAALGLLPERIVHQGSGLIRIDLWKSALAMLRDHPVFGVGLDQFLNQYQGVYIAPTNQRERWLSHPHNIVLDWWLSLGIMGVLLAGWIGVRAVRGALALTRRTDVRVGALARAALAGLVAVLAHGLIDNSYFLQDLALTVWLFCALLQIMWQQAPAPAPAASAERPA
jgi:polysaccharide biosynthesis protein PslG